MVVLLYHGREHMGSLRVHDFIKGTTIALPPVSLDRSIGQDSWDILRPNQEASELVARHVRVLGTLGSHTETEGSSNIPAKVD